MNSNEPIINYIKIPSTKFEGICINCCHFNVCFLVKSIRQTMNMQFDITINISACEEYKKL